MILSSVTLDVITFTDLDSHIWVLVFGSFIHAKRTIQFIHITNITCSVSGLLCFTALHLFAETALIESWPWTHATVYLP